jgi:tetratricopeptide (TPR) repeat protein
MSFYSSRQVREILGLSPAIVARLVKYGFVTPSRGPRRELRFSFKDLVVLRAAKGLADARLPIRRISASLRRLRQQLPAELPSKGLRIAAVGNAIAVFEGRDSWRASDGQYLLAFEVAAARGEVVMLEREPDESGESADDWFEEGCRLEGVDSERAIRHYFDALAARIAHPGIYVNLGRLLHEVGRLEEAQAVYGEGIAKFADDALLHFNRGVLMEERSNADEALACYKRALALDRDMADAHYNLGLLYDASGKAREALRHFSAYRKLHKT